jgi:hypothetical protein
MYIYRRILSHEIKYCDVEGPCRQRFGKDITAGANARNSRTSIIRKRISKYVFLTIEAVFYVWSVQSCYEEMFSSMKGSEESNFVKPACRVTSLELN